MADLSSITAALSGLKHASEIARQLRDTDRALGESELKLQIADLMGSLADARTSLADIHEALRERDAEIQRLQEALSAQEQLVRHNEVYYRDDGSGNPDGDPYCPLCWESEHRLIHLTGDPKAPRLTCFCPNCKNVYRSKPTMPVK